MNIMTTTSSSTSSKFLVLLFFSLLMGIIMAAKHAPPMLRRMLTNRHGSMAMGCTDKDKMNNDKHGMESSKYYDMNTMYFSYDHNSDSDCDSGSGDGVASGLPATISPPKYTVLPESNSIPTTKPSITPTLSPTPGATNAQPTPQPSKPPTAEPTTGPTAEPTAGPTAEPTAGPTAEPTAGPTTGPTAKPTAGPTAKPSAGPTAKTTAVPTAKPSAGPTAKPTAVPTGEPTAPPSDTEEPPSPLTPESAIPDITDNDSGNSIFESLFPDACNGSELLGMTLKCQTDLFLCGIIPNPESLSNFSSSYSVILGCNVGNSIVNVIPFPRCQSFATSGLFVMADTVVSSKNEIENDQQQLICKNNQEAVEEINIFCTDLSKLKCIILNGKVSSCEPCNA